MDFTAFDGLEIVDMTNASGRRLTGMAEPPQVVEGGIFHDSEMDLHTASESSDANYFGLPEYFGPFFENGHAIFKKVDKYVLFADAEKHHDVCLDSINQKMLGLCYFYSALDFAINHPYYHDKIRNLIKVYDEEKKIYTATLRDTVSGTLQTTYVDQNILLNGKPIPTIVSAMSSHVGELWPSILEKAYVKMVVPNGPTHSFKDAEGGFMVESMAYLFGGRGYMIPSAAFLPKMLADPDYDNHFTDTVMKMWDAGYGVFLSWTPDKQNAQGLVDHHAYCVLDIKQYNGEYVFKIKNPWGNLPGGEWAGKFSDADNSAEADTVRALFPGYEQDDDGIFLMPSVEVYGRADAIEFFEPDDLHVFSDYLNTQ